MTSRLGTLLARLRLIISPILTDVLYCIILLTTLLVSIVEELYEDGHNSDYYSTEHELQQSRFLKNIFLLYNLNC